MSGGARDNTGRKRDAIWSEFTLIAPNRVKCRHCSYECAPIVQRMQKHFKEKHENATVKVPSVSKEAGTQPSMDNHIVKTSKEMAASLDYAVGRFFFSANVQFSAAENYHFKVKHFKVYHGTGGKGEKYFRMPLKCVKIPIHKIPKTN